MSPMIAPNIGFPSFLLENLCIQLNIEKIDYLHIIHTLKMYNYIN